MKPRIEIDGADIIMIITIVSFFIVIPICATLMGIFGGK